MEECCWEMSKRFLFLKDGWKVETATKHRDVQFQLHHKGCPPESIWDQAAFFTIIGTDDLHIEFLWQVFQLCLSRFLSSTSIKPTNFPLWSTDPLLPLSYIPRKRTHHHWHEVLCNETGIMKQAQSLTGSYRIFRSGQPRVCHALRSKGAARGQPLCHCTTCPAQRWGCTWCLAAE